jgi:hypothetical protein
MVDVHIGELTANVALTDDEAPLTAAQEDRLLERLMARLDQASRTRGIAEANTRLGRAAAPRPDRLRQS